MFFLTLVFYFSSSFFFFFFFSPCVGAEYSTYNAAVPYSQYSGSYADPAWSAIRYGAGGLPISESH